MFIIINALFSEIISCFRQDRLDNASPSGSIHITDHGLTSNDTEIPPVISSNAPHFQMFGDIIILHSVIIALLATLCLVG